MNWRLVEMDRENKAALVQRFLNLPATQQKVFYEKLQEKGIGLAQLPIPSGVGGQSASRVLSYAQQRQWFLWQLAPDSSLYHIPTALHLNGDLDLDALQGSFSRLFERHDVLHTAFIERDGEVFSEV